MGVARIAAYATISFAVLLSVGVGFYDWRAGLICFAVQGLGAGLWTLTKE